METSSGRENMTLSSMVWKTSSIFLSFLTQAFPKNVSFSMTSDRKSFSFSVNTEAYFIGHVERQRHNLLRTMSCEIDLLQRQQAKDKTGQNGLKIYWKSHDRLMKRRKTTSGLSYLVIMWALSISIILVKLEI